MTDLDITAPIYRCRTVQGARPIEVQSPNQYRRRGCGYADELSTRFQASRRTVVSWVEKARRRGILSPVRPGQFGGKLDHRFAVCAPSVAELSAGKPTAGELDRHIDVFLGCRCRDGVPSVRHGTLADASEGAGWGGCRQL